MKDPDHLSVPDLTSVFASMLTCPRKHYREYLVSLINSHSVDPAPLYSSSELLLACKRYKVEDTRRDGEDSFTFYSRLLEVSLWEERVEEPRLILITPFVEMTPQLSKCLSVKCLKSS